MVDYSRRQALGMAGGAAVLAATAAGVTSASAAPQPGAGVDETGRNVQQL